MKNDSPTLARIVLGILAAILLGTFFAINVHSQHQLNLLKQTAQQTEGFVSSKHCKNYGSINYTYRVEGKEFTSSSTSCVEPCREIKIGTPVKVIYSFTNPKLSACNDVSPSEANISSNFLLLAIVSIIISITIYRMTRNTN